MLIQLYKHILLKLWDFLNMIRRIHALNIIVALILVDRVERKLLGVQCSRLGGQVVDVPKLLGVGLLRVEGYQVRIAAVM